MSQSEKTVGAVGAIRIDSLEITITPLSQAEEMALDRELRRAAETAAGDHWTRNKPLLDALKDSPADRLEVVREITRLSDSRAPLAWAAVQDFRFSAPGLAIELYHRGKKATDGLDRKSLAAIITDSNADVIAAALLEVFKEDAGDNKSAAGA